MTAHGLGRAVNDDVRPEAERTLQQRGRQCVVDHAQDAPLARERAQTREVGEPEQRVRRRFEPEHVGPVTCGDHRLGVGDVDQAHLRAAQLLQAEQAAPDIHVGDLGRDDRRLRREEADRRGGRCHPRGERERLAAFERTDDLLERFPWRVAVARVAGRAAGVQRRCRRDRHVQRPVRDRRRAAGADDERFGPQAACPAAHADVPAAACPRSQSRTSTACWSGGKMG